MPKNIASTSCGTGRSGQRTERMEDTHADSVSDWLCGCKFDPVALEGAPMQAFVGNQVIVLSGPPWQNLNAIGREKG